MSNANRCGFTLASSRNLANQHARLTHYTNDQSKSWARISGSWSIICACCLRYMSIDETNKYTDSKEALDLQDNACQSGDIPDIYTSKIVCIACLWVLYFSATNKTARDVVLQYWIATANGQRRAPSSNKIRSYQCCNSVSSILKQFSSISITLDIPVNPPHKARRSQIAYCSTHDAQS